MAKPMPPLPQRGDHDCPAPDRRRRPRGIPAGAAARVAWRETMAVWLPWLVAPVFVALPIGGCGLGERMRQAAARPIPAGGGLAAKGAGPVTLVTFEPRSRRADDVDPGPVSGGDAAGFTGAALAAPRP